jgi:hypothetical protein
MKYLTKSTITADCDFCSQMSQYATLKTIADKKNFEVVFRSGDLYGKYGYHLDKCFNHVPTITKDNISFNELTGSGWGEFPYQELGDENYNINIDVSCYKNYHDNYDSILNLYSFRQDIIDKGNAYFKSIKEEDEVIVSVHFRRGDYLVYSSLNLSLDYFNTAVEMMNSKLQGKKVKYLIFSNGMDWVKENFKVDNPVYCEIDDRYVELYLQTICNHHIIANSSYSWWGAYLNKSTDKIVMCPVKYSGNPDIDGNYYPDNWIAIDKV